MTAPRVSCIMPTRDRRVFVAQAQRYFLRQDYPDTELVVVDDGHDAVEDLIVDHPRVRYLRLDGTRSIGAKRNVACEAATGDVIAHWDDDDWSAPDRLRRQVGAMLDAGADACGLSEVLHYRPREAEGWLYRGTEDSVAGCSIVYRRSAWARGAFADVSLGEDSQFIARLPRDRVVALGDRSLMVAVHHGRNASTLPLGTRQWERAELGEIGALFGADRTFYATLRGAPPAPRAAWRPDVEVAGYFDVSSGYGSTGEYLALSLHRTGAAVRAVPLGMNPPGLTDEFLELVRRPPGSFENTATILHSWMRPDIGGFTPRGRLFISSMWESSRLPVSWVPWLNGAEAVVVPSAFVAAACRDSGVRCPVAVVPLGVDPDVYHWQPREEREGLTTLIVAPLDHTANDRKHTRLAIDAWREAFGDDAAARLIIKTAYGYRNYVPDDARITYVDAAEPTRGIAHWYGRADVLLALGNEGFGMPLVEGMATGLPVIALDAEGQADVCRDAHDLLLPVPAARRVEHRNEPDGPVGHRSVPDRAAVVRHLRWVDEHRDEARAMGEAASAWATEQRSVWAVGPRVLEVVEPAATGRRSRFTVWAGTAGEHCGIAAYTHRLARSLPVARTCTKEPPVRAGDVVHVQYEPSVLADARLERYIERARATGAAVAVTTHAVQRHAAPWERSASALVAATSSGAAWLRERNPGVPVAHIPLGCETWRPPRKPARGRTVGFFGFPGGHKGLARIAAALRELPGCDVVLFAHDPPHISTAEVQWPAEVPVRREPGWLPLARVAAELAAAADVLVFHYDEVRHRSASSAVLLGLSTGVPVVTSDTSWFADFGPAVHRAGTDAADLAGGLERMLVDDALREHTTAAARAYCAANSWSRTAAHHVDLWNSLRSR